MPVGCIARLDALLTRILSEKLEDSDVAQLYAQIIQEDVLLFSGLQLKWATTELESRSAAARARAYILLGLTGDAQAEKILSAKPEASEIAARARSWALGFLQRNGRDTSIEGLVHSTDMSKLRVMDALAFPKSSLASIDWRRAFNGRDEAQFSAVFRDHPEINSDTSLAPTALYYIISGKENALFLDLLGELLAMNHSYDLSIRLSTRAVNEGTQTTKASAETTLGNTLSDAGKLEEANKHYLRSIELGRSDGWPEQNLAMNYASLKDYSRAESSFRTSFERHPSSEDLASFQNNFADFLATRFPTDQVRDREALQLSIESNRHTAFSSANSLDTLAECYAAVGDYKRALFYEQRALAFSSKDKNKISTYSNAIQGFLEKLRIQNVIDAFDTKPSSLPSEADSPRLVLSDVEDLLGTASTSTRAPGAPSNDQPTRLAPYECRATGNPLVTAILGLPDDWDCECAGENNFTLVRLEAAQRESYLSRLHKITATPFFSCETRRFYPLYIEETWCRFVRVISIGSSAEMQRRISLPTRIGNQLAGSASIARVWVEQGAPMTPEGIPEGKLSTSARPIGIELSNGDLLLTVEHQDRLPDAKCGELAGFRGVMRLFDISGYNGNKEKILSALNMFSQNLRLSFESAPLLAETDASQSSRRKYWFTRDAKASKVIDDGVHFERVSYTAQIILDAPGPQLADFAQEAVFGVPDKAISISLEIVPYVELATGSPAEPYLDPSDIQKSKYASAVRMAVRAAVAKTCKALSGLSAADGSDVCILGGKK
jgi:tetratricopeptide (TPR) repeat protein